MSTIKKRRMTASICGLVVILAIVAGLLMSATSADVEETLNTYKGLLYVKHGRVGSKSEGPDYYLQTFKTDYLLQYKERVPWEPDYHLEFYCRRMVEVKGKIIDIDKMTIRVESIHEICERDIPRPD